MTVVRHPLCFSLFFRLKIKPKGRHFDTTEVMEAESQAMLNTLTEHDFQDAFQKQLLRWEWVKTHGRKLLRACRRPVGPKLAFDQMVAPVTEIMDMSSIFAPTARSS
jgi:hypothetical protein